MNFTNFGERRPSQSAWPFWTWLWTVLLHARLGSRHTRKYVLRLQSSFFSNCSLPLSSLYKRCNLARVFSKDRAAMKRTASMHAATVARAWKAFESITRTWTFSWLSEPPANFRRRGRWSSFVWWTKSMYVSLARWWWWWGGGNCHETLVIRGRSCFLCHCQRVGELMKWDEGWG